MTEEPRHARITVRDATLDDAAQIALIRVETWRAAYRGLVPAAVLDSLDAEKSGLAMRQAMARKENDIRVLAGCVDDLLCGFAIWNHHGEDPVLTGELRALYVLPAQQRHGLGRLLFQRAARAMQADGFTHLAVFALESNRPAHRFYQHMGGVPLPYQRTFEVAGISLPETGYRMALP